MMQAQSVFLLLCITMYGCAHGERPAANCKWPTETPATLNLRDRTDQRHLRDDALRAEDLAIRYADSVNAPHSGHFEGFLVYNQTRDSCMTALFDAVARNHAVPPDDVRTSLTRRPVSADLAIMLSFAICYAFLAYSMSGQLARNFPFEEGYAAPVVATIVASVVISLSGVLVGEWYSLAAENIRVGSGHLSYRIGRIPWNQHRPGLFLIGVVLFWLVAAIRYRQRSEHMGRPSPLRGR